LTNENILDPRSVQRPDRFRTQILLYIIVNKHTHPHDYHDYLHNVPLINNLLHNNNTRDYKPFISIL